MIMLNKHGWGLKEMLVLSGILVGMLGYHEANTKIVAAGSYLAGMAGELAQERYTDISMKASDTIEMIPEVIKRIRKAC